MVKGREKEEDWRGGKGEGKGREGKGRTWKFFTNISPCICQYQLKQSIASVSTSQT